MTDFFKRPAGRARTCLLALLAGALLAGALAAAAQPASRRETLTLTRDEAALLKLVNQERVQEGLPELRLDYALTDAARYHSELMAAKKVLSHQVPGEPPFQKRMQDTNLHFGHVGENVAFNQSVARAHEGLMRSPGHRANILSPDYNSVGIGILRSGDSLYVTQDFARVLAAPPADEAERQLSAAVNRHRASLKLPPLRFVPAPSLHKWACEMSQRGQLDTRSALALPAAHWGVAFTAIEADRLPSDAQDLAGSANATAFSVGVCYQQGPGAAGGLYWVLMTFY